jgi:hypothetical protein
VNERGDETEGSGGSLLQPGQNQGARDPNSSAQEMVSSLASTARQEKEEHRSAQVVGGVVVVRVCEE